MNAELLRTSLPPATAETDTNPKEPLGIRRVLVVDDEDGVRQSLAEFLSSHGFEVFTAADARSARALVTGRAIDLVLTDITMPEVSGLELMREVKAHDPSIEVILITGYLDISYAVDAMRHGAWDFFTKPFNYDRILLTIARVDETRRFRQKAREYEVLRRQREFEEQATLETTLGLARAVEERDRSNIGHGKRTANFSLLIGRRLGFDDEHLRALRFAALLHDIGKIGIDDGVLNKPGRLTEVEMVSVRRHAEIGEYILSPISFLRGVARIVRHHHERWDGTGYPDGLCGERIPLDARILCLADYFDSITSARPYRRPMDLPSALDEIRRQNGLHFDPVLTDLFIAELSTSTAVAS